MKTHRFVTTIVNKYLVEFKDIFGDKSRISSIWIGGVEYTRRGKIPLYYALFDNWRRELFNLMGEKLNIKKFYHHLRKLYKIVGTLIVRHPETYKKAKSVMWKMLSELDNKFKLHKKKREIGYFKSTVKRIEKKVEDSRPPTPIEPETTPVTEPEQDIITPEEKEKPKKSPFIFKKIVSIVIILILLLILVLSLAFSNKNEQVTENRTAVKTEYYNETLSNKISFEKYLDNINDFEGKNIELKCFLKRYIKGTEMAGVYVESITDDYGNTIDLINMDSKYKVLFPNKGTTEEVYLIEGIFRKKYPTLVLEPSKIKLSERDPSGIVLKERTVEHKEEITRNVTKPRYPFVRSFVFSLIGKEVVCDDGTKLNECSVDKPYFCSMSGVVRNPTKCGCPEGERLYKKECIKKVECNDGTLEPDCSENKPKQCVDGKLIDNAKLCGCTEDYKIVENSCVKIQRCSDGTIYGECSKQKPYFCSGGELIKDPDTCGCEWGYKQWEGDCIDKNKFESLEAFEYINSIREENNRKKMEWDDNLYELAVFRSKDMETRGYFDHVTPEGKCVKDFKAEYGFADYNVAENCGGMTHYADGTPIPSTSVKEAVDGWLKSRGHRYNLLYPYHKKGAVGCYKAICVFLGANKEYYGLGYGPCTTGEEGLAYWESASKQPEEI